MQVCCQWIWVGTLCANLVLVQKMCCVEDAVVKRWHDPLHFCVLLLQVCFQASSQSAHKSWWLMSPRATTRSSSLSVRSNAVTSISHGPKQKGLRGLHLHKGSPSRRAQMQDQFWALVQMEADWGNGHMEDLYDYASKHLIGLERHLSKWRNLKPPAHHKL